MHEAGFGIRRFAHHTSAGSNLSREALGAEMNVQFDYDSQP